MSTTTMHFGPEWMRPKHQSVSRTQPPPSPPPILNPPAANASTYSALVSPAPPVLPEKQDEAHPFRYSKEEMLRIYKEGGGKGGLGLEVERWEGVVRETGADPVGLREMGEAEKKLFATSVNSDLRRRQSNDYLNLNTQNLERPRLTHANSSSTGSPLRERYGSMGLIPRRRDSTDQPPTAPRKLSLSGQAPLASPRDVGLPSPRRLGHTGGFDGVLNGGDSWVARRRASEGPMRTSNTAREPSGGEENEIREEEEEIRPEAEPKVEAQDRSEPPANTDAGGIALQRPEAIDTGMAHLSLDNNAQSATNSPSVAGVGPPPGITDLANIEWSYVDPQGHIQGPFRADLMQKWSDDGYFTPDLLMKRTTIDTEWISVAELARRTGGGKMFLSPIASPIPPGLARRTDSPFGMAGDPSVFNNPFQPSPIRSMRSSTLDSYIGTGSNPSDSPASSFGGGRFGNGSPDPSAFGGRVGQFAAGDIGASRVTGFGMGGDASPALARRNTYGESMDLRSPGFNNILPSRGAALDNGFPINGGAYGSAPGPWNTGTNYDALNGGRGSADSSNYQPGFGNNLARNTAPLGNNFTDVSGNNSPYRVNDFGYGASGVQHGLSQDKLIGGFNRPMGDLMYNELPAQSLPHSARFVPNQQMPAAVQDVFDQNMVRTQNQLPINGAEPAPISPWGALDPSAGKRPGPFDPPHPTSTNTSIITPLQTQVSPWGNVSEPTSAVPQAVEPVPAQSVPETTEPVIVADAAATSEESTIIRNEGVIEVPSDPSPEPEVQQSPVVSEQSAAAVPSPIIETAPAPPPPTTNVTAPKIKTKAAPPPPAQAPIPIEPTASTQPSPQTPAAPAPKAPWAKDDDSKKAALSLRQIQDAEAKKAEARKAAERERERVARANANAAEEVQSFTTSWGLPTSQAGKSAAVVPPKEVTVVASTATPTQQTPAAVWTTAAKAATSKPTTMKEIQEEEERRKKAAVVKEAPAPRRPYAESTNKAPTATQSNAWTTVGPSGKAVATPGAPVRPPAQPSTPTASSTSTPRPNGAPTARPVAPAAKPPPSNAAKTEDFPLHPSNDFMRWLGDNMKGLNNTVNVEEIMSMLLSFPLDPDPSTTEIISDLIYANSTTLDGRRFAADFVSKRKADAVARSKNGAAGAGSAKPISIADVVKAQPKPQTSEWGGFKVVNKKKKGGRS
ncbi:kinesin-like protein [Paramarasmius palmivorus]|uniref:Kinesin-like protein n=1 Tax=Paramarasmius palmivorus TaxID=297713 RepID=A0AAW0CT42_9AGAR